MRAVLSLVRFRVIFGGNGLWCYNWQPRHLLVTVTAIATGPTGRSEDEDGSGLSVNRRHATTTGEHYYHEGCRPGRHFHTTRGREPRLRLAPTRPERRHTPTDTARRHGSALHGQRNKLHPTTLRQGQDARRGHGHRPVRKEEEETPLPDGAGVVVTPRRDPAAPDGRPPPRWDGLRLHGPPGRDVPSAAGERLVLPRWRPPVQQWGQTSRRPRRPR